MQADVGAGESSDQPLLVALGLAAYVTPTSLTPNWGCLPAVRWSIRQHGGEPSCRQIDQLLDERWNSTTG